MRNLLCALLGLTLNACSGGNSGKAEVDFRNRNGAKGKAIATFNGNDQISDEQLKQLFADMNPYARARYQELSIREDYVKGLARFELLAAEALSQGLANDEEVVLAAKKVMVQKLLKRELDEKPTPISDAEVQAYYDKRKNDYVKPEMIRLSHLFLNAPQGSKERAEKAKLAQSLLEKAQSLPPLDYQSFGALVRENSEDEKSKALDGDLRFLSFDELGQQFGKAVADAAQPLRQVGQLAQTVVATDKGFHILKLQGRQAALNLAVEQVKPQIQSTLIQQKRMSSYKALIESLEKKYQLKLDTEALKTLSIDFTAPTKEARAIQPGFAPPPSSTADLP